MFPQITSIGITVLHLRSIALTFIFFTHMSFAITNIENERLSNSHNGTKSTVSLTLDGREGSSDKISFGADLKVIHISDQDEFIAILSRDYGEVNKEVNTDKVFVHLRYLTKDTYNWGHEVFSQFEEDEFRSLSSRTLWGGGVRYTLTPSSPDLANSFGLGLFHENEDYVGNGSSNDESTIRLNLYWAYKNYISENATYTSTLYFQPSIEEFDDQKGLWESSLTVNVTSKVSLSLIWNIVHDTQSPETVVSTETSYKTVLNYEF